LLLGSAGQAHENGVDAFSGNVGGGTQTLRISLTDLQIVPDRFVLGLITCRLDTQFSLGRIGLGAQCIDFSLMLIETIGDGLMIGITALKLIAQGIAFLLQAFEPCTQGIALGLHQAGGLNQLPDSGSERI
jgi:hypothetical protein